MTTTARFFATTTTPLSKTVLLATTTSLEIPAETTTGPIDQLTDEELETLTDDSIALYDVNHTAS